MAATVLDLAPDAIFVVDGDGGISSANLRARELFGHDDFASLTVSDLVPPALRGVHAHHRAVYAREPRTRTMGSGLDLRAVRADGSTFPVEVALAPVALGSGAPGVVAVVRDVTERLETDRQLQAVEQELNLLEDRERIARDLHDTVIQRLFAAGMSLQATTAGCDAATSERVEGVIDQLDLTIREIRQAIFRLTAHNLDSASVRRQLLDVIEAEQDALAIVPELVFTGPVEVIGDEIVEHLVATLREALSNVARHAHAGAIRVTVEVTNAEVLLVVDDDGVGLEAGREPGNGLHNMAERATALGGTSDLSARSPRGCRLTWRVPQA